MSQDSNEDEGLEDRTAEQDEPSRGDASDTEHPTGEAQAAENAERESPA